MRTKSNNEVENKIHYHIQHKTNYIIKSTSGARAFIIDHDPRSYAMIARSFDGVPEGLTRERWH